LKTGIFSQPTIGVTYFGQNHLSPGKIFKKIKAERIKEEFKMVFRTLYIFTLISVIFSNPLSAASPPTLRVSLGVTIETFDPTEAEDYVTIRVMMNLGRGLVSYDKNLKPIPGLATRWTISPDGKNLSFLLGKRKWSDGTAITASDFVRGFERTCSPGTVAKLASPFLDLIEGAKEYKSGALKDFSQVGIVAKDENTIEFRLKRPAPYFVSLLALPFAFPQKEPFKIAPGTPTSGAYRMSSFTSGSKIALEPNPHFLKPPQNNVEFKIVIENTTALALFEKKELDVLEKIPSSDFKRFEHSPYRVSGPFLATYYLGFNVVQGEFADKNRRAALAHAIDRSAINKILKDPQHPSRSWVPTPLPSSKGNFAPAFNAAEAKRLWKMNPLASVELHFDSQEKNNVIAALLQQELKHHLDLKLSLRPMEWKSYLRNLADKPSFFRFAWLAPFPDPVSHLGVFTTGNPNNYTGYANPEYDKLVEQIGQAGGKSRLVLLEKAQNKLLKEDVVIIPLYHYIQYLLIDPRWKGLEVTPMGLLYFDQARRSPAP
jgi:oligopeptide transport system substrate-binding protein